MSSLVAPHMNALDMFPPYSNASLLDSPPSERTRKDILRRDTLTAMPTSSPTMKSRPKLKESCDHCAKAKVKCNKDQPTCSRCRDRHLHCGYSYSRRAGRRPGRSDSMTQPTSPESSTIPPHTITACSTPTWPRNSRSNSTLLTDMVSTSGDDMESYPASLASPYMSPYMTPSIPADHFGGYSDCYSVSSSPVNTAFGFGSLSLNQSPPTTAPFSLGQIAHNPTSHAAANVLHAAGDSGSTFESSRTDISGYPIPLTNTAMSAISTSNPTVLPGAWLDASQSAAASTPDCLFAQNGETCVERLTKALHTQATSSTEPSTVADLMAANRSILHIAVAILSCSCAARSMRLSNLLVYAARIVITRYEIGAGSGVASCNLLGDIPYLERFLSILAETLGRSEGAWAAASFHIGDGTQHHRRSSSSASSFSTVPAPLVEVCTRTLALKALLRQNLAMATA